MKCRGAEYIFSKEVESAEEPSNIKIKIIENELKTICLNLPIECKGSNIFIVQDIQRIDVLKILVFGGNNSRYAHEAFLFDIWVPNSYPNDPIKI